MKTVNQISTLYFGLRLPQELESQAVHFPLITIQPRLLNHTQRQELNQQVLKASHLLFTSASAIAMMEPLLVDPRWKAIPAFAVGEQTARACRQAHIPVLAVATPETAEGMVALLEKSSHLISFLFWAHSSQSRPVIQDYLLQKGIPCSLWPLYHPSPLMNAPLPDLSRYERWIFTSPSTVQAFILRFGHAPDLSRSIAIGPITQKALELACADGPHCQKMGATSL